MHRCRKEITKRLILKEEASPSFRTALSGIANAQTWIALSTMQFMKKTPGHGWSAEYDDCWFISSLDSPCLALPSLLSIAFSRRIERLRSRNHAASAICHLTTTATLQPSDQLQQQLQQLKQQYDVTTRDLERRIATLEEQIQKEKEASEKTKQGTLSATESAFEDIALAKELKPVKELKTLPAKCQLGDNRKEFQGGSAVGGERAGFFVPHSTSK